LQAEHSIPDIMAMYFVSSAANNAVDPRKTIQLRHKPMILNNFMKLPLLESMSSFSIQILTQQKYYCNFIAFLS